MSRHSHTNEPGEPHGLPGLPPTYSELHDHPTASRASLLQGSAWQRTWLVSVVLVAMWLALLASMSAVD